MVRIIFFFTNNAWFYNLSSESIVSGVWFASVIVYHVVVFGSVFTLESISFSLIRFSIRVLYSIHLMLMLFGHSRVSYCTLTWGLGTANAPIFCA